MNTVAGIFRTRAEAKRGLEQMRALGLSDEHLNSLSPETTEQQVEQTVPTSETEQPGMGNALGGVVGGAMGAAGGMTLGAAAASLLVPGVGPIMAAGFIGAALFGAGGAFAGAAAGGALEGGLAVEGLPHDELFVYEDALRQGRTVVIAQTDGEAQSESVRRVLNDAGAESVDAARESWWVGLRDAEAEAYTGQGSGDFKADEPIYRRGFEAALNPQERGATYDEAGERLRLKYGEACEQDAFRCGYTSGQSYHQTQREKPQS